MWQDIVIGFVSFFCLTLGLIPQTLDVIRGDKEANKFTAATTAAGLVIIAVTETTIDLWISATITAATGALWGIMLYRSL